MLGIYPQVALPHEGVEIAGAHGGFEGGFDVFGGGEDAFEGGEFA